MTHAHNTYAKTPPLTSLHASDFTLPTSYVESPCVSYDGFSLNRTAYAEGMEGAEAIVTFYSTSRFLQHFTFPTSRFRLRMLARTEGTEAIVTSYFRLHASYFILHT